MGTDRRIVVVDDDVWVRQGRAEAVAEVPGLEVLAVLSHPEAMAFDKWDEADVALVRQITKRGMSEAFAPGVSQEEVPLSRRGIINARRRLADLARLTPNRYAAASQDRVAPEWRALVRFVNWARGAERPEKR